MKDTKVHMDKWGQNLMQKWIEFFEKDTIQTTIKSKMLDPILNHILKKIFPYIILICVMFALLLLAVLITLGVIVFQMRSGNIDIKLPSKVV
jgi:ABC-type antimicrobial peptide transport system permease subunit